MLHLLSPIAFLNRHGSTGHCLYPPLINALVRCSFHSLADSGNPYKALNTSTSNDPSGCRYFLALGSTLMIRSARYLGIRITWSLSSCKNAFKYAVGISNVSTSALVLEAIPSWSLATSNGIVGECFSKGSYTRGSVRCPPLTSLPFHSKNTPLASYLGFSNILGVVTFSWIEGLRSDRCIKYRQDVRSIKFLISLYAAASASLTKWVFIASCHVILSAAYTM